MPDDFDFFNDEPAAKPKPKPMPQPPARAEPVDDDAHEPDPPPRARPVSRRTRDAEAHDTEPDEGRRYQARGAAPRKRLSPLLIGGIALGALVVVGGIVGIIVAVSGGSKPTEPKGGTTTGTALTAKPAVTPKKEAPADPNNPSPEVVEKVKKATVKVLVQFPGKKGGGSGSGFVEKDSRLVLTNAHVVAMKKMTDPQPLINLVCNSGVGEQEYRLDGEVVALDAENDLAIIRPILLEVGKRTPVPDGLVVPRTSSVTELQRLFVFGFPLGSALGSEISIRPTQVTSLRHDGGKLKKIQVEGGMTFGNSGGPVVDVKGNVIGVAVSGIKDANINFCVPGEMVQQLLAKHRSGKE